MGAKIEGIYRKEIYELPPQSIRELIVNAVMNCSFLQPSHIQVAIYDDRLEITSPGGLLPGVTVERMKEGYSQIRNRALAHAFSYMNLIEEWGTGIPRLMREMKEYGLREPEFIDMELAFRVNLYRSGGWKPESAGKVPESAGKMPEQQEVIYQVILENGYITTTEVAQILSVKQRRARMILKYMSEIGMIRKIGASRSTRYVLPEEE